MMPTQVFDVDGTERSLDWLREQWDGCEVLPATVPAGVTEYWQLAAIFCTVEDATMKAEVRRGINPADNQPVVITWPALGSPSSELPTLPPSPNNWATRGVIQRTEASGITGFGLGITYGPFYHVWVLSSAPSDCLHRSGMKGETNHHGPLHGVWVLTPVAPAYATLEDALHGEAQVAQVIQFNPQAALQRRIFADGFVPNSPEFTVRFATGDGPERTYICQRAEHLGTGVCRCYYCIDGQWDVVQFIAWRP